MATFRELLEEYQRLFERIGGEPFRAEFWPAGIDAKIEQAEEFIGVEFPDDLRTWFRWYSGRSDLAKNVSLPTGPPGIIGCGEFAPVNSSVAPSYLLRPDVDDGLYPRIDGEFVVLLSSDYANLTYQLTDGTFATGQLGFRTDAPMMILGAPSLFEYVAVSYGLLEDGMLHFKGGSLLPQFPPAPGRIRWWPPADTPTPYLGNPTGDLVIGGEPFDGLVIDECSTETFAEYRQRQLDRWQPSPPDRSTHR